MKYKIVKKYDPYFGEYRYTAYYKVLGLFWIPECCADSKEKAEQFIFEDKEERRKRKEPSEIIGYY